MYVNNVLSIILDHLHVLMKKDNEHYGYQHGSQDLSSVVCSSLIKYHDSLLL
jgi:hypothetical protein